MKKLQIKTFGSDQTRLLLAGGVIAIGIYVVLVTIPAQYLDRISWKWVRFAAVSMGFVGYSIKAYWRVRSRILFWVILFGALTLHLGGMGYIFYWGKGLPLLLFGPAVGLELGLMMLVMYYALRVRPHLN